MEEVRLIKTHGKKDGYWCVDKNLIFTLHRAGDGKCQVDLEMSRPNVPWPIAHFWQPNLEGGHSSSFAKSSLSAGFSQKSDIKKLNGV